MWLCVGISSPLYGLRTWSKCQKTQQVFVVCTQKNFLLEGCGFFVSDIISGGLFSHLSPGRQPLDVSISLKSLLETRLQSESFNTLDDLLGFQVQKL